MKKQILIFSLLFVFGACLYAQPKAVGEPRLIAKADEPLERPMWSADGSKLSLNYGRWEVSSSGKNLRRVSATATGTAIKRNAASNDVLQQMIDNPVNAASQIKGLETLSGYMIFNPVLSPAGDKIVFQASRNKGLFVCNTDGSGLRKLDTSGIRPTWTGDGKFIIATVEGNDGHNITDGKLIAIDVATGQESLFFASAAYIAISPAVSPDGKVIAFEDYASGAIYIMDIK